MKTVRIEITHDEWVQLCRDIMTYCPTDTAAFTIIERKARAMQARDEYIPHKKDIPH